MSQTFAILWYHLFLLAPTGLGTGTCSMTYPKLWRHSCNLRTEVMYLKHMERLYSLILFWHHTDNAWQYWPPEAHQYNLSCTSTGICSYKQPYGVTHHGLHTRVLWLQCCIHLHNMHLTKDVVELEKTREKNNLEKVTGRGQLLDRKKLNRWGHANWLREDRINI